MHVWLKNQAFLRWRYVVVALAVVGMGSFFFFGRGSSSDATLTITSADFVQKVNVSGTVIAAKDVDLGFTANGRVAGVYANVGKRVLAGAILAEIENGDLQATLAQEEADLASLLSGTRSEEIAVEVSSVANAASVLVDAIQAAYTASDDAVRNRTDSFFTNPRTDPKLSFAVSSVVLKTLVERDRFDAELALVAWANLIPKLSAENVASLAPEAQAYLAKVVTLLADANAALNQGLPDPTTSSATLVSYATTLAVGRTNVNSSATTLTSAISALNSAVKKLELARAGATKEAIAAQKAAVANARAALAKTYVTAPFTGVVTRMDAKVGEIVSPTTPLISLQSDGIFHVETYVPEVTIMGVAVGNKATTTLDAYGSSVAFPAVVVAVDPAETMKDGVPAYKTTLAFLVADPRIRSGMTANVVITVGVLPDAIVIPRGSLGSQDGVAYVSVVQEGGTVNRPVVTGTSPALGQTEIRSGLSDGDVILLSPAP